MKTGISQLSQLGRSAWLDCISRPLIETGKLKATGIDVDEVCGKLLEDGVVAFEKAFDSLFEAIEKKHKTLLSKKES